jgi:hypothetical protein
MMSTLVVTTVLLIVAMDHLPIETTEKISARHALVFRKPKTKLANGQCTGIADARY